MIFGLLRKRPPEGPSRGETLYSRIVATARRPAFYRDLGVPDTLPGRFELIVLHAALCVRRLGRDPDPAAKALSQELFDAMFSALDANLREIGIGDASVPKRIKTMARSFYDGAATYDAALDDGDDRALAAALGRIVFDGAPDGADGALALAAYARRAEPALAAQSLAAMTAEGPAFPDIGEDAA